MSTIITRSGKGFALTWNEVDANFTNLNSDKTENSAAAITGGSINNTTIGNTTPNAATFTSLSSNGTTILTNGSSVLSVDDGGGSASTFRVIGPTASLGRTRLYSGNQLRISTGATNSINFYTAASSTPSGEGNLQLQVSNTASAVNYVQVTGAATTVRPIISVQGSDTNAGLDITAKGTGSLRFLTANGATEHFRISNTTSAVNRMQVTGSVAGSAPILSVDGSDTNIDLALTPKGTGLVRFGTRTASADVAITGYIEIKDSGGTTRRLAVIG